MRGGISYSLHGAIVHALYISLEFSRELALELLFEDLIDPLVARIKPSRKRARVERLVNVLRAMYVALHTNLLRRLTTFRLDRATYFVLVSLEFQASLQQLELVQQPLVTLRPFKTVFRHWSWLLLPPLPALWNLKGASQFLVSLILSPSVTFCALQCITETMEMWTSKFCGEFIPAPEDRYLHPVLRLSKPGDDTRTIVSNYLRAAYRIAVFDVQTFWGECKDLAVDIGELVSFLTRCLSPRQTAQKTSSESREEEETFPESNSASQRLDSPAAHEGDEQMALENIAETDPARLTASLPPLDVPVTLENEVRQPSNPSHEAGQAAVDDALATTSSPTSTLDDEEQEPYRSNIQAPFAHLSS